jgi:hypothetical protein
MEADALAHNKPAGSGQLGLRRGIRADDAAKIEIMPHSRRLGYNEVIAII